MTKTKPRARGAEDEDRRPAPSPTETLRRSADALYRAARECCRQRERYAQLIGLEASSDEEQAALDMVTVCDDLLLRLIPQYETAAAHRPNGSDEEWWRSANSLWLASREYQRRHQGNEAAARSLRSHDSSRLVELATEFDLEASALLAMCHALESYRRVRPEAAVPLQRASAA